MDGSRDVAAAWNRHIEPGSGLREGLRIQYHSPSEGPVAIDGYRGVTVIAADRTLRQPPAAHHLDLVLALRATKYAGRNAAVRAVT